MSVHVSEKHDDKTRALALALHKSDIKLLKVAIRIPAVRDIMLQSCQKLLTKSQRASETSHYSGLTHIVCGLRDVSKPVLVLQTIARSADSEIKNTVKPAVYEKLYDFASKLSVIEYLYESNTDASRLEIENCYKHLNAHLTVLNFYPALREQLQIKVFDVVKCVRALERKASKILRDFGCYASAGILLNLKLKQTDFDNFDLSAQDVCQLRKILFEKCGAELLSLKDATGVSCTEQLLLNWFRLKSLQVESKNFKEVRDEIIEINRNLVVKVVRNVSENYLRNYCQDAKETKLLETATECQKELMKHVFRYNPEFAFSTFAIQHIEQDAKATFDKMADVVLPAAMLSKQPEIFRVGTTVNKNGETIFDYEKTLRYMQSKYPSQGWDMQSIRDVKHRQQNGTFSLDQPIAGDDDSTLTFEDSLSCENDSPENLLASQQEEAISMTDIEKIISLLNKLPPAKRDLCCKVANISMSDIRPRDKQTASNIDWSAPENSHLMTLFNSFVERIK